MAKEPLGRNDNGYVIHPDRQSNSSNIWRTITGFGLGGGIALVALYVIAIPLIGSGASPILGVGILSILVGVMSLVVVLMKWVSDRVGNDKTGNGKR